MKLHYITRYKVKGIELPDVDPAFFSHLKRYFDEKKPEWYWHSEWKDLTPETTNKFLQLARTNVASFGILRVLFDEGCLYVNHGLTAQGLVRKRVVFEDNKTQIRMTLWDSGVDDREMVTLYTTPDNTITIPMSQTATEKLALDVATGFINNQFISPDLEWKTEKLTPRQWRHYHTRVHRDNEPWPQNVVDAQLTAEQIRQYIEMLDSVNLRGILIRGSGTDLFVGGAFPHQDDPTLDYPNELHHATTWYHGYFNPLNILFQNYLADLSIPEDARTFVDFTGQWTHVHECHVFSKSYAAHIACHFFDMGYPSNGLIWSGHYQVFDREHRQPVPPTIAKILGYDEDNHYKRLLNPPLNMILEAVERLDASQRNRVYIQTNRGRIFIHSSRSHPNRVCLTLYEGRPEGIIQQSYLVDSAQYGKEDEVEIRLSASKMQKLKLHETISKEFAVASVREYFETYAIHNQYWKMNWYVKPSSGNT